MDQSHKGPTDGKTLEVPDATELQKDVREVGMSVLKRPSLGEVVGLGTLYDARSDQFLINIIKHPSCEGAISKMDMASTEVNFGRFDTYREKFKDWDISPALGANVLAGLVSVEGSSRFLKERRESNRVAEESLVYTVTTVKEIINFQARALEGGLILDRLEDFQATHVVHEILWGSRSVVTFKKEMTGEGGDAGELETELAFWKLNTTELRVGAAATIAALESELAQWRARRHYSEDPQPAKATKLGTHQFNHKLKVTIFGDVLADDNLVPTDAVGAWQYLSTVPKYIARTAGGKGKPLSYSLLPISFLGSLLKCTIAQGVTTKQLSKSFTERLLHQFDEIAAVQRAFHDYHAFLRSNHDYVSPSEVKRVVDRITEISFIETDIHSMYEVALREARAGKNDGGARLRDLSQFISCEFGIDDLAVKERLQFIKTLVKKGAMYTGFNGESPINKLASTIDTDVYVFKFNDDIRRRSSKITWVKNVALLHQLLVKEKKACVLLWDADAFEVEVESPAISLYRNAEEVQKDVLTIRENDAKYRDAFATSIPDCPENAVKYVERESPKARF